MDGARQQKNNIGYRLSPQQRRLWTLHQVPVACCAQGAALIDGDLDGALLQRAVRAAIDRHEILRTSFRPAPGLDAPLQVVAKNYETMVNEVDLSLLNPDRQKEILEGRLREERTREVDFGKRSLLSVGLITLLPKKHVLTLTLPAFCADMSSILFLFKQIIDDYRAGLSGESKRVDALQYVEFSEWQYELLEADGEEERRRREFWGRRESTITKIRLPGESAHISAGASEPQILSHEVERDLMIRVEALAEALGTTISTIFLACWQNLLWRLTAEPLITVMTAFDCRKREVLQETLGPLAKHLPIQCHFASASSFGDIVNEIRRACDDAYLRQEFYRPDSVHEESSGRGKQGEDGSSLPIGFEYAQWPADECVAGTSFTLSHLYCHTDHLKLKLFCMRTGGTLRLEIAYDQAIYPRQSAERLAGEFMTLLRSCIDAPEAPIGGLEVISEVERRQLLTEWNATALDRGQPDSIKDAFESLAGEAPDATAAVYEDRQLTYAELSSRANRLAHSLRASGVGPEVVVGICMERSLEMLVGVLGVLKAGGAYLPLDPTDPPERRAFILEDAAAPVLLTQQSLLQGAPGDSVRVICLDADLDDIGARSMEDPVVEIDADNLAYVIYTSGSTGSPKGVMIRQDSALNLFAALRRAIYAYYSPRLRISLNAPLAFDASVKQLMQLLAGHTLCVIPEDIRLNGVALLNYIERHQIEVFDCTPSQLRLFLEARRARDPRAIGSAEFPKVMLVGGEAIDARLWRRMSDDTGTSYYNVYGPTECTVDATARRAGKGPEHPTIGRPLANTEAYILDAEMRLAPIGVAGELYLGGAGLARGYLDRPGLTAEKFIAHPFGKAEGARLYRTGDRANYLACGEIQFLGRNDNQIKMRGYRIELEEIEAALIKHPAILECAALAQSHESGNTRLVAYVALRGKHGPNLDGDNYYTLPNDLVIAHLDKPETERLYHEIFVERSYLRHGVGLPPDACVFDVGANIGLFALFVEQQCARARIYSFEPIGALFECLRLNGELYGGNVRAFDYGLSGAEKEEYFPRHTATRFDEGEEGRSRRLSDVIREEGISQIDLLKVDARRARLDVLQGVDEDDWGKIRQIVIQIHNGRERDSEGRIREVGRMLENRGFRIALAKDGSPGWADWWNLYAVAEGDATESRTQQARKARRSGDAEKKSSDLVTGGLRRYLAKRLPEYMLPSAYLALESLPLTKRGKLDRAALTSLRHSFRTKSNFVAPRNDVERAIAAIWQDALNLEEIGVEDRFFDLGGNSMLLALTWIRIRERLGKDFALVDMFRFTTINSIARYLSEERTSLCRAQEDEDLLDKIQSRARMRDQAMRWHRQFNRERG